MRTVVRERTSVAPRLGAAPRWMHVAALALFLVVAAPFLHIDQSFTTDEGAYALQVQALEHGSWARHSPVDAVDPTGRWFPIVNGAAGSHGRFPYVSHPAYVVA